MKMLGSRSIACTMPSERACQYLSSRMRSVDVFEKAGHLRPRAVFRGLQNAVDFVVRFLAPRIEISLRGDTRGNELLAAALHRALLHPGLNFLLGSIGPLGLMVPERPDVFPPAVGIALEEERTVAAAAMVERLFRRLVNGKDIIAVGVVSRDLEAANALAKIGAFGLPDRKRALGRVEIVLAHVQYRQFPDRGEIQAFVGASFLAGAFAEERNRYVLGAVHLVRKRGPCGERHPLAEYRRGAEESC